MIMKNLKTSCPCQDITDISRSNVLWSDLKDNFNVLRKQCPAIELLMPDEQWEEAKHSNGDEQTLPYCLNAYENGSLKYTARMIHEFIIEHDNVNKQYISDLAEKWIKSSEKNNKVSDERERHNKNKIYSGKLLELMFAWVLKENGFEIEKLEAWDRNAPDIVAVKSGVRFIFECKFSGQETNDYINDFIIQKARPSSHLSISNYLWFKICEAADQLSKRVDIAGYKLPVIFLQSQDAQHLPCLLHDGYFNPSMPAFVDYEDLLKNLTDNKNNANKKELYQDIFTDPHKYIEKVDNFLIFEVVNSLKFNLIASQKPCVVFETLQQP